jgi:hypothetical protein
MYPTVGQLLEGSGSYTNPNSPSKGILENNYVAMERCVPKRVAQQENRSMRAQMMKEQEQLSGLDQPLMGGWLLFSAMHIAEVCL